MAWGRVGRSYLLSPSLGIVGSEIPRYCVILSSQAGNLTTQRQALAVSPEVPWVLSEVLWASRGCHWGRSAPVVHPVATGG